MDEFLERPEVFTTIVWGTFSLLVLGIIVWGWASDRRQKRKIAERRRAGEDVPERTFLSLPDPGEMTPGMKLYVHSALFVVLAVGGYWLCNHLAKDFSDLESGKVPSIKVDSLTAWTYRTMGAGGALGLTAGLVILMLLRLGDEILDACRALRSNRQRMNKGDKNNP